MLLRQPTAATPVTLVVRKAVEKDGPAFVRLVQELAAFEKLAGPDAEARARLLEDAFGPRRRFELVVGELDGAIVAYGAYFETYSTFRAAPVLYLEDIYVTPAARRHGVAAAMMHELAREAIRHGCVRMSWVVLDWNKDAQKFYQRLGARPSKDWLPYEIEGEALESMAQGRLL